MESMVVQFRDALERSITRQRQTRSGGEPL